MMSQNIKVVEQFFNGFKNLDESQMEACYADTTIYSDPVFGILKNDQVRSMWQMICSKSRNQSLQYFDIEETDHEYITCRFVPNYFFEPLGKQVHYVAKAFMRIQHGKIIEHSDGYRLSSFIANSYGLTGKLFGWSGFMKRKVQNRYHYLLNDFIDQKPAA